MIEENKVEFKVAKRDDHLVLEQIQALTALLNCKVSHPKYSDEKVKGVMQRKITGNFEITPFSEQEIYYLKSCVLSLTSQGIEKGELLKVVDKQEESKDAAQLELELNKTE
jgi:hypothetical protein